ncbi:MAG TPA: serine protease [Magnetospirillaceae bacterium]|nr:serine protease [Magnetospirillaceae bacterium]
MKRVIALLIALATAPALAEPPEAALVGALGVQIEKPAGDHVHFSQGSGVYLGDGLVLTAAHVVAVDPANPVSSVILDGWKTDARLIATGANGLDLALLKIEPADLSRQRRDMKRVDTCPANTAANQPVVVAALGTVTLSKTVGFPINAPALKGDWTNILATGYTHGASGGGLFDAGKGCLAGIVIIEATAPGVELTQFVPAPEITVFLSTYHNAHQN